MTHWQIAPGFRFAGVVSGLRAEPGRRDIAVILSDRPAAAAGVFTQNQVVAAPVQVSRARLPRPDARAVVVCSGNANACTGDQGLADARRMTTIVADLIGCPAEQVLVASTGVIGRPLPMAVLEAGIPAVVAAARPGPDALADAAHAILTTDTRVKVSTRVADGFTVTGFAKGAAMIGPNLATMLGFVVTDAPVRPADLHGLLAEAAAATFNCVSVEGHTSTNDTVFALANGPGDPLAGPALGSFGRTLHAVCADLAKQIAADAEGATHLVTITVDGCRTAAEARQIAKTVAESALVKTAIFGADPNWGSHRVGRRVRRGAVRRGRAVALGRGHPALPAGRAGAVRRGRGVGVPARQPRGGRPAGVDARDRVVRVLHVRLDDGLRHPERRLHHVTPTTTDHDATRPLLALAGVGRTFGPFTALSDVTLTLPPGRVGLLGPNGAGKSTLLKILMGLLPPTAGTGAVLGRPLARGGGVNPELRRLIGFMPETDALVPGLTGLEYVGLAGELYGMPRRQAARRAHEVLSYLGLDEARYRRVEDYSAGMKQRVKLAQAVVHDPPVLLLDEPTSGLDPAGRDAMLALVRELGTDHGKSVILSTHLLADVQAVCDRVVIVAGGRVKGQGTVEELCARRADRFRLRVQGENTQFRSDLTAGGGDRAGRRRPRRVAGGGAGGVVELDVFQVGRGERRDDSEPGPGRRDAGGVVPADGRGVTFTPSPLWGRGPEKAGRSWVELVPRGVPCPPRPTPCSATGRGGAS